MAIMSDSKGGGGFQAPQMSPQLSGPTVQPQQSPMLSGTHEAMPPLSAPTVEPPLPQVSGLPVQPPIPQVFGLPFEPAPQVSGLPFMPGKPQPSSPSIPPISGLPVQPEPQVSGLPVMPQRPAPAPMPAPAPGGRGAIFPSDDEFRREYMQNPNHRGWNDADRARWDRLNGRGPAPAAPTAAAPGPTQYQQMAQAINQNALARGGR